MKNLQSHWGQGVLQHYCGKMQLVGFMSPPFVTLSHEFSFQSLFVILLSLFVVLITTQIKFFEHFIVLIDSID